MQPRKHEDTKKKTFFFVLSCLRGQRGLRRCEKCRGERGRTDRPLREKPSPPPVSPGFPAFSVRTFRRSAERLFGTLPLVPRAAKIRIRFIIGPVAVRI